MNEKEHLHVRSFLRAMAFGTALFDLSGPLAVLTEYRREQRRQSTAQERR